MALTLGQELRLMNKACTCCLAAACDARVKWPTSICGDEPTASPNGGNGGGGGGRKGGGWCFFVPPKLLTLIKTNGCGWHAHRSKIARNRRTTSPLVVMLKMRHAWRMDATDLDVRGHPPKDPIAHLPAAHVSPATKRQRERERRAPPLPGPSVGAICRAFR